MLRGRQHLPAGACCAGEGLAAGAAEGDVEWWPAVKAVKADGFSGPEGGVFVAEGARRNAGVFVFAAATAMEDGARGEST